MLNLKKRKKMKLKNKFIIVIVVLFTQITFSQIWNKTEIKGNNNVVTQEITTQKYSKINVSGSIDVELVEGKEGDIILQAEENLIEYIEVYCKNNTLTLKIRNNTYLKNIKQIKVQVPIEEISHISLAGSSTITGRNLLEMNELDINVAGSGEMSINVNVQNLDLNIVGSGNLSITGSAENCFINVAGSGDLNGENLVSNHVNVKVAGSGQSVFECNNTLKAYVVGSGSVKYTGNPEILESKILGSGSIDSIR